MWESELWNNPGFVLFIFVCAIVLGYLCAIIPYYIIESRRIDRPKKDRGTR